MTTPVEAQAAYPALPLPAAATEPAGPKSPILALVLSLFPGIGQIYNGQPAKAMVFFFAWAGSIMLVVAKLGPGVLSAIGVEGWWGALVPAVLVFVFFRWLSRPRRSRTPTV